MRVAILRLLQKARSAMIKHRVLFSSHAPISTSSIVSSSLHPNVAMSSAGAVVRSSVAEQKHALRSRIKKELRSLPADQRSQEDMEIQNFVLDSSWFKSAKRLCAYISCEALREVDTKRILSEILKDKSPGVFDENLGLHTQLRKKLYVPRVEDKNSNMRMLHISTTKDLVANSMNICEPSPTDASGNHREDVMLASEPVDIFLLPGVAFDRQGRRLGRGGGYYDVFLKKYQELAKEQKWKQPLLNGKKGIIWLFPCVESPPEVLDVLQASSGGSPDLIRRISSHQLVSQQLRNNQNKSSGRGWPWGVGSKYNDIKTTFGEE